MRTTVVCTDNNQMIRIIGKYGQYPIFEKKNINFIIWLFV